MTAPIQAVRIIRHVWTHPANAGGRLAAVARAVGFQLRGRLGGRSMTTVGRRARMWVDLHSSAASAVLYANPPDWNEMRAWRRILRPGDLFVDVGSNVGGYALWAADAGAVVIAIEPSPGTAARLRENVALNEFPITVRQCALADRPGTLRLTRGRGTTNHLTRASDAERVTAETLDGVLSGRYAAGVKIDVEGAERLVLAGGSDALARHRIGVLQLEWNAASRHLLAEDRAPVAELLRRNGYRLARPDAEGRLLATDAVEVDHRDMFAVAPGISLPG